MEEEAQDPGREVFMDPGSEVEDPGRESGEGCEASWKERGGV